MSDSAQDSTATATSEPFRLQLDVEAVKGELVLADPEKIGTGPDVDPELEKKAQDFADMLVNLDSGDLTSQDDAKAAVETMGRGLQREAAHRSAMLKQPIRDLSKQTEDGGPVANALIDLKMKVEELDPSRFDFSAGWFTRLLGMIPGIGTPIKRYFTKYESAETVIDAIIRSLELGGEQLKRDNITLSEDQRAMRELTIKLQRQIELARLLDQKLQYKLDREIQEDKKRKFVEEELLFPLRQRIIDLQQQLAVNQQGVLSMAIIVGNNKELVRGVARALDVTVSALQVAVTVALALAHQKIVLDKITALNATTSSLIAGTAAKLKTQGTAIHAQASQAGLDMEALKSAFADINAAMDEISRYRREALPQMAQSILEFDKLATEGEAAIEKMEQGTAARPVLDLES